jgi:SNF family Na+-dependent transporter
MSQKGQFSIFYLQFVHIFTFKKGTLANSLIIIFLKVYPYAVTKLQGSVFWAFIFFLMMLTLGIDTMMSSVEILVTSVFDILPKLRQCGLRRRLTITCICIALFAAGLLFCTRAGTYWVEIFDAYSGNWAVLFVALLELVSVAWFYGLDKFAIDMSAMLGQRVASRSSFNTWSIFWRFLSPVTLAGVVLFCWLDLKGLALNGYVYPAWSNVFGNFLSVSSLIGTFGWMVYSLVDVFFINKRVSLHIFRRLIRVKNGRKIKEFTLVCFFE